MGYRYRLFAVGTWVSRWLSVLMLLAPLMAVAAGEDAVSAVQVLRMGGCGGLVPATPPLRRDPALDRAAAQWATGASPAAAARDSGYMAEALSAVRVNGPDVALLQELKRSSCHTLTDRGLQDVGAYARGRDNWLLIGSRQASVPAPAPNRAPLPGRPPVLVRNTALEDRALELVNDIRAKGTHCGSRVFGPVAPVTLSTTLSSVALGHAADMAQHDYFEHEDLSGRTPADRVRAVGYAEKLVGENIAYGPTSADEVVQGWLDSPGHCENIMDPRFAQMGIAFSAGHASRHGLYWVQLLVAPKV